MAFQQIAAKVAIDFSSYIKIFEITAFGHVTEVSIRKEPLFFIFCGSFTHFLRVWLLYPQKHVGFM